MELTLLRLHISRGMQFGFTRASLSCIAASVSAPSSLHERLATVGQADIESRAQQQSCRLALAEPSQLRCFAAMDFPGACRGLPLLRVRGVGFLFPRASRWTRVR